MIIRQQKPGWGFLAASGRTTLSEGLDGGGSDNHVFLGDVSAFMMQYFAGIRLDPDNPGFQHFFIKPHVVGNPDSPSGPEVAGLTWVKCHHDSPYGRIESNWKIEGGKFMLEVKVPVNSTATVILPGEDKGRKVESGTYRFENEWKK